MNDAMQPHNFLWFLIVGGLAGWIASWLVKGSGMGLLGDIVVGGIGAILGGSFAYHFNITLYGFWEVLGMAVLGAVVLLLFLRAFSHPRKAA